MNLMPRLIVRMFVNMKTVKVNVISWSITLSENYILNNSYLTDLCDFVKLPSKSENEMYGENCPLIFF